MIRGEKNAQLSNTKIPDLDLHQNWGNYSVAFCGFTVKAGTRLLHKIQG